MFTALQMQRFWSGVDKSGGPNACWPWTRCKNNMGYGRCRTNYREALAHRIAYTLSIGPIPDGLFVLHSCDNPLCCNPAHLSLGTQTDNIRDCVRKGRNVAAVHPQHVARGERVSTAKLTAATVSAIRREYTSPPYPNQLQLASKYNVHNSTISVVVRRQGWTHVD